jgi:hypothetical protein
VVVAAADSALHALRESRRITGVALGAAAVAITLGVWAWLPQFATYRGLSGLDCALFALPAATAGTDAPDRTHARAGIEEAITIDSPSLEPADRREVMAGVMHVLEDEDFFGIEFVGYPFTGTDEHDEN